MTADTGKKPSVLDRFLNALRPKRQKTPDIVAQAEEILERYAGRRSCYISALRRKDRSRTVIRVLNAAIFAVCAVIVFLLWQLI